MMVVTLVQQYNVGEKPTVILYTYINRHAGTPKKTLTNKNIVVHTTTKINQKQSVVVVDVVVDSYIQRIVLATEETTVTQQVSHRPIKCQSRLWSQRGTKVNGSHHGDNPLLRPTAIQIATKSYAALQAMAPTNIKTVHQTSLLHIESNLDRLGMLSPTHDQRSQQKTGKNASTRFDQQVQVSQGHTLYRNEKK